MQDSKELNSRLLKERVHAALGAFKNLNVFLWPDSEQEGLIERTLDEIAKGYETSGRTELRFTETMPGGRKEERTASFADVERLQKGLDALRFGERALEFVRPTAEQIQSGAEDWGVAQAAKGYALFEEQDPKGAMAVQGLDDVGCFESDRDAARQWEIDTGKRVLQPGVDFWFGDENDFIPYIDTPENRKAMKDWLLEKPLEFHWPDFSEKKFKEIVKELHSGNVKEGAKARACLGSSWFDLVYDGENKIYRLECRCNDTAAADYISTTYRPITLDDTKGPAEFRASLERDIIGFMASIGSEALRSECMKDPSAAFEGCEVKCVRDKNNSGFFKIAMKSGEAVAVPFPSENEAEFDDYWVGFRYKGRDWDLNFFGASDASGPQASVYSVGEGGEIDTESLMKAASAEIVMTSKMAKAARDSARAVSASGAEWDALCDLAAAAKMDWFFEEATPSSLSKALVSDVETAWLSQNLEKLTGERFFAVRGLFQRAGEKVSEEEVPERFKIMDEIIQWMSDESELSDWTDAEREVARQAVKDWESVVRDPEPDDEEKEDERYDHETLGMLEVHAARVEAMRKWRRLEKEFDERPDIRAWRGGFAEIKDEVFENDETKAKLPWKDEPGFLSRESLENLKMDFSEAIQAIERPQREAMEETVYRLLEEWVDFGPLAESNAEIGELFDEKFVKNGWDDSLAGKNCFYADSVGALREIVDNGSFKPSYVTASPDGRSVATDEGGTFDFAYHDPDYKRKAALMKSHSDRMEKRSSILEQLAEEVVSGELELSGVQEKASELSDLKVALRNDKDLSADFNKMGREAFLSAHPDVLPEVYDASVRDAERLLKDNFETAVISNLNVDWTKDEKEPEIEGVKILDLSPESAEGKKAALVAFKNQGKNFTGNQILKALEAEKEFRWVKIENLQVFPYDAAKETLEEAQKGLLDSVKAKDISAGKEMPLDKVTMFEGAKYYGREVKFEGETMLMMEDGLEKALKPYFDGTKEKTKEADQVDEGVYCYVPADVLKKSDKEVLAWCDERGIQYPGGQFVSVGPFEEEDETLRLVKSLSEEKARSEAEAKAALAKEAEARKELSESKDRIAERNIEKFKRLLEAADIDEFKTSLSVPDVFRTNKGSPLSFRFDKKKHEFIQEFTSAFNIETGESWNFYERNAEEKDFKFKRFFFADNYAQLERDLVEALRQSVDKNKAKAERAEASAQTAKSEPVTCGNFQRKLAELAGQDVIQAAQALLAKMDKKELDKFKKICEANGAKSAGSLNDFFVGLMNGTKRFELKPKGRKGPEKDEGRGV